MRPENDIKNPYVWLILFISAISSIPVFYILNITKIFHFKGSFGYYLTGLYLDIIISTLPIIIVYWILWTRYTKSEDFKKRYNKNK